MGFLNMLKPNACVLGFGLFLALNAAGVWDGVFPFLPDDLQSRENLTVFFIARSLALLGTYAALAARSYLLASLPRLFDVAVPGAVYALGWFTVMGAMYLDGLTTVLLGCAGVLLGNGSAAFLILWQRAFAGSPPEQGARELMVGAVYSGPMVLFFYLIPKATTTLLIPLLLMPLFALCLVLKGRTVDPAQPCFADNPRKHPDTYRRTARSCLLSSVGVGTLAFCCGLMRAYTIGDPLGFAAVNAISMLAVMVGALVLLYSWYRTDVVLNVVAGFRLLFPFAITALVAMAWLGSQVVTFVGSAMHAVYGVATTLVMLQCIQICANEGVRPAFAYGLLGGLVYLFHDVGYILGCFGDALLAAVPPYGSTALLGVYLLSVVYFLGWGGLRQIHAEGAATIELRSAKREKALVQVQPGEGAKGPGEEKGDGSGAGAADKPSPRHAGAGSGGQPEGLLDRISKQCLALQDAYGLSNREREVVELLARGNSAAGVAARLVLSESTVKTHMQRIYAKLDIHKKQELLELVESSRPR